MANTPETPHILIIDDDSEIRGLISELLDRNAMVAEKAKNTTQAEAILKDRRVDLVVLDVMMPGEDGLAFCQRIRRDSQIPIIMLTALGDDVDRILGLEFGADDYLPKPFNPRELIARIKTVLRRAPPLKPTETYRRHYQYAFADLLLDVEQRALRRQSGDIIDLTSGEYALLLTLIEHSPRVLSRDQLLDLTRGAVANPFDRSIDSQISRLRRKIEPDPKRAQLIKTVRNIGYAFAAKIEKVSVVSGTHD